jgi:hypothetical protein
MIDPVAYFNSPDLADVVIVLKEEDEPMQRIDVRNDDKDNNNSAKRQKRSEDADAMSEDAAAQVEQQQQQQQERRLHGHKVLLSSGSTVFQRWIAGWSSGDGNELLVHVSHHSCLMRTASWRVRLICQKLLPV